MTDRIFHLIEMGRFEQAEAEARKELAQYPDSLDGLLALGIALGRQSKPRQAEEVYRRLISIAPEWDLAYAQLADALDDRKKYKPALEAIDKAIELSLIHI